jgi:hypothetical protein
VEWVGSIALGVGSGEIGSAECDGMTVHMLRTLENPHGGLIPKTSKFRGHKMANFGDLYETFMPKSANLGGAQCLLVLNFLHGKFKKLGLKSIFGGLVPYISAPDSLNLGICIIHVGSRT